MKKKTLGKAGQTKAKPNMGRAAVGRRLKLALVAGRTGAFVDALGAIVEAEGATRIAKWAGVSRKEMEELFSPMGRAEIAKTFELIEAVGLHLELEAVAK